MIIAGEPSADHTAAGAVELGRRLLGQIGLARMALLGSIFVAVIVAVTTWTSFANSLQSAPLPPVASYDTPAQFGAATDQQPGSGDAKLATDDDPGR